jgi:hypothetical protein
MTGKGKPGFGKGNSAKQAGSKGGSKSSRKGVKNGQHKKNK